MGDKALIDLIISENHDLLPEEWQNNKDFHKCVQDANSLHLDNLKTEPQHLQNLQNRIKAENQQSAVLHYDTFIETATCSREIYEYFDQVQLSILDVCEDITKIQTVCKDFLKNSQTLLQILDTNEFVREKKTKILEILEVPQLLDTSVRSNYIDEVLDALAHVHHLQRSYNFVLSKTVTDDQTATNGTDRKKTFNSLISDDIKRCTVMLLNQLLNQLCGSLQLPQCLKIIGYLRRLEVFNEQELLYVFLQCRQKHLNGLKRNLSTENPYQHATKLMEVLRTQLFDVITQFRVVCFDDDLSSLESNDQPTNFNSESMTKSAGIFDHWIVEQIFQFIHQLEEDLLFLAHDVSSTATPSTLSGAASSNASGSQNLSDLLAQALQFGASFSRIGCDFRCHIAAIFVNAIEKQFQTQIESAYAEFHSGLGLYVFASESVVNQRLQVLQSRKGTNTDGNVDGDEVLTMKHPSLTTAPSISDVLENGDVIAPMILLDYPLLALLCNRILLAFNHLRQCCPVNVVPHVRKHLTQQLVGAAQALLDSFDNGWLQMGERDRQGFLLLCETFSTAFLTHIEHCCVALWSSQPNSFQVSSAKAKAGSSWIPLCTVLAPLDAIARKLDSGNTGNDFVRLLHHVMSEASMELSGRHPVTVSDLQIMQFNEISDDRNDGIYDARIIDEDSGKDMTMLTNDQNDQGDGVDNDNAVGSCHIIEEDAKIEGESLDVSNAVEQNGSEDYVEESIEDAGSHKKIDNEFLQNNEGFR